jgi:hypothetical protein
MPLDSKFYVERPVDEALLAGIERRDSILLIKGARQIGKTSLLARGLREARLAGNRVVLTDLQKLTQAQFADLERFYLALGQFIADQLDLDTDPEDNWRPNRSPNLNFERFLRRQVLAATDAPLFWAIDETDRLFSTTFGTEVFALIRSWHNDRALDPEGPWSRLTLAIAYATEAYLFIDDPNQSPFNVGTRLTLDDFTLEQIADLNRRYGGPLAEGQQLNRFHALVDGQPYLVRRGLDLMARERIDIDELEARADLDSGPFGDHLRRILVLLARDPELCEQVRSFLRKPFALTPEHFHRLTSAGLMAGRTRDQARFRCGIYERYLRRQLA